MKSWAKAVMNMRCSDDDCVVYVLPSSVHKNQSDIMLLPVTELFSFHSFPVVLPVNLCRTSAASECVQFTVTVRRVSRCQFSTDAVPLCCVDLCELRFFKTILSVADVPISGVKKRMAAR